jgi:hypothetical protein
MGFRNEVNCSGERKHIRNRDGDRNPPPQREVSRKRATSFAARGIVGHTSPT